MTSRSSASKFRDNFFLQKKLLQYLCIANRNYWHEVQACVIVMHGIFSVLTKLIYTLIICDRYVLYFLHF